MKITYIYHSSYLVELKQVYLLFDYYKGNIPDLDKEKTLFVFVSHRHSDHFSDDIFKLAIRHPNTIYFISDDIRESKIPVELHEKIQFMGANELMDLYYSDKKIKVHTYKSTDEGVAFLIDIDDKRIYHAGDLNYWFWKGETKAWNNNMKANYLSELDKIANDISKDGLKPDLAFVPVDSRLEEYAYLGVKYFMEIVGAKNVFPMHVFGDLTELNKLDEINEIKQYLKCIFKIHNSDERFEV